jgi:hypothetical protein
VENWYLNFESIAMIHAIQVSFVIAAAVMLAACSHLRAARQRIELRGIEEDWGVAKRERILEKKRLWEESIYGR